MSTINFDFDICPQARAIQAALAAYREQPELDGLTIRAWPLFNGRERGICLVIADDAHNPLDQLLISFGEDRKSDRIFIQITTTTRAMMNGPEMSDFSEYDYSNRFYVDELRVHEAIKRIFSLIKGWKAALTSGITYPVKLNEQTTLVGPGQLVHDPPLYTQEDWDRWRSEGKL